MREKQGRKQAGRATAKRREQGRHSHRNNASKVTREFSFLGFFFSFGLELRLLCLSRAISHS
jgi:hypothetical protein